MILWFLLPVILYLGIITSLTDLKEGKIKNIHILIAVLFGIFTYCIESIIENNASIVITHIETGAVALLFGILLWYEKLWAAGDAKLFSAFLFLIPIENIYQNNITTLPINLFVNALFPIGAIFIIFLLIKTSLKEKKESLKKAISIKIILKMILQIFAIGWIGILLLTTIKIAPNIFTTTMIVIVIIKIIEKIKDIEKYFLYGLLSILNILLNREKLFTFKYLISFILIAICYSIIMGIFDKLSKKFIENVLVENLKTGMIPAEIILRKRIKKRKDKNTFEFIRIKSELLNRKLKDDEEIVIQPTEYGLTKKDIEMLKIYKAKHIKIQKNMHFAPYLFLGTIITLILAGNMITIFS